MYLRTPYMKVLRTADRLPEPDRQGTRQEGSEHPAQKTPIPQRIGTRFRARRQSK
jgi:hypothetical protein